MPLINSAKTTTSSHEGAFGGSPVRLLVIGEVPPPDGGVTTLLKCLVDELHTLPEVKVSFIDSSSPNHRPHVPSCPKLLSYAFWGVLLLTRLTMRVPFADVVSLHVVTPKLALQGLIVQLLCRVLGKPLILRKFGGTDPYASSGIRRLLNHYVLSRCDCCLVETRQLTHALKQQGICHVYHFPNHRRMPASDDKPDNSPSKERCQRFVFVGQVKETKGVRVLLEAAKACRGQVSVDFYGELMDGITRLDFAQSDNVQYKGVVSHQRIFETLRKYDALVLPSYHDGEGYPGVVLEAFGAGLPVISTRWRSIPEIVDPTCGILVPPGDSGALRNALTTLASDRALYVRLRRGAKTKAGEFSVDFWARRFAEVCRSLRR